MSGYFLTWDPLFITSFILSNPISPSTYFSQYEFPEQPYSSRPEITGFGALRIRNVRLLNFVDNLL